MGRSDEGSGSFGTDQEVQGHGRKRWGCKLWHLGESEGRSHLEPLSSRALFCVGGRESAVFVRLCPSVRLPWTSTRHGRVIQHFWLALCIVEFVSSGISHLVSVSMIVYSQCTVYIIHSSLNAVLDRRLPSSP